ncbi:unnamed protein product [Brassica napus]|uniref:(rape) hypothetical protein n=1 Tax=Brassica napus TaxID=3708 RepID=A0A816QD48_BRANA|nr:unnamed protein product [Brassica napus]
MDCSICTTKPSILRPPRNTICGSCYEGARTTIALLKKLEGSKEDHEKLTVKSAVNNGSSLSSSPLFSRESQPFEKVIKWMENMKETEDKQKKRIVFVSSFVLGFKEGFMLIFFYTPAMMDLRSMHIELCWLQNLFKNILDSDKYKTAPEYAITLQELNSEELQALFVLDVLDVSDLGSSKRLKEAAIGFVVQNMDDIIVLDNDPIEESVVATESLTREDLIAYFASGCKPKQKWRIGTEHEKFGFERKCIKEQRSLWNNHFSADILLHQDSTSIKVKHLKHDKETMDAKNKLTCEEPEEIPSPKLTDWLKSSTTPWRSPIPPGFMMMMMPSTPLAWRFGSAEFTLKEDLF